MSWRTLLSDHVVSCFSELPYTRPLIICALWKFILEYSGESKILLLFLSNFQTIRCPNWDHYVILLKSDYCFCFSSELETPIPFQNTMAEIWCEVVCKCGQMYTKLWLALHCPSKDVSVEESRNNKHDQGPGNICSLFALFRKEKKKVNVRSQLAVSVSECSSVSLYVSSHNYVLSNSWIDFNETWYVYHAIWCHPIGNTNAAVSQVFESVTILKKSSVFWNTMPGSSLRVKWTFGWKYLLSLLLAACRFLAYIIFDPEDGGNIFLRNVSSLLADYMTYIPEDTLSIRLWKRHPRTLIFLEHLLWSSWK